MYIYNVEIAIFVRKSTHKLNKVRPKKHLGQHFLNDQQIALKITGQYRHSGVLLEIGPGMGVLTQYLVNKEDLDLYLVEIDTESVQYLLKHFNFPEEKLLEADFLKLDLLSALNLSESDRFGIIGNFPYNISSQIFFKILDYKDQIHEVVGMVQKEVGKRIASEAGNKDYGILSVLLQAYYDIEYCFTVPPGAFTPPPKVDSGVIRLVRNFDRELDCEFRHFKLVVKTAFNQRRKKLSNALKPISGGKAFSFADQRAEQLDYNQFVTITKEIFS